MVDHRHPGHKLLAAVLHDAMATILSQLVCFGSSILLNFVIDTATPYWVVSRRMKPLHHLLGIAVLAAIISTSHAQTSLTNGLVGYWPFNGNANDASGHGLNGTINGATLATDRFGRANAAYSFDGSSSYISFAGLPTSQTNNWTVSSWIKPASLPQLGTAVCVGFDNGISGTANGYQMCINSGDSGIPGNQFTAIYGGIATYSSGIAFASTNTWTQIVLLRSNGIASFYVNGTKVGGTVSGNPRVPTAFTIGSCTGFRFFNGLIDDVRVYNRALSANEVVQLYSVEATLPLTIRKAVYVDSGSVTVGSNYQVQISSDLINWSNQGSVFTATNAYWRSAEYWDVDNWSQLFFRLLPQ
jgi:hypothetical protein